MIEADAPSRPDPDDASDRRPASLACAIGWHRPDGVVRWNEGYYFARCKGCGRDIVRTAYQGWHVPTGFRVVWQPHPPADFRSAALIADPLANGDDDQMELPIAPRGAEEADVHAARASEWPLVLTEPAPPLAEPASEPAPEAVAASEPSTAPEPGPEPEPAQAQRRASAVRDFMDDEGAPMPAPSRGAAAGAAAAIGTVRSPDDTEALVAALEDVAAARDRAATPPAPGRGIGALTALAIAMLVLVGGGLLLGTWLDRGRSLEVVIAPTRSEAAAPVRPAGTAPDAPVAAIDRAAAPLAAAPAATALPRPSAFVAASLLNCRESPAIDARIARTLSRGAEIAVLARDQDWVSLGTSRGQCWALARYLTLQRPV